MDIAPLLVAGGSTLFASMNTYILRRQNHRLKLLKGKQDVSVNEIRKCILERDEMTLYLNRFYTVVQDCLQVVRKVLSVSTGPAYRVSEQEDVHVDDSHANACPLRGVSFVNVTDERPVSTINTSQCGSAAHRLHRQCSASASDGVFRFYSTDDLLVPSMV